MVHDALRPRREPAGPAQARGRLPLEEALRIAGEAGRALDYAHREGVIHRDIKPENILLTLDGDTLVADFGIARALGGPDESRLTQAGLALGTPAYMAPEQATGERGVDARHRPVLARHRVLRDAGGPAAVRGDHRPAVIAKRFTSPAPSARRARPELPEQADRALQRALALDPAERFGTIAEFIRALGASTASTPPGGMPAIGDAVSALMPEPPARRIHPMLVIGGLIALAVLAAGVVALTR